MQFIVFWLLRIFALASIGGTMGFLLGAFLGGSEPVMTGLTTTGFIMGAIVAVSLMFTNRQ